MVLKDVMLQRRLKNYPLSKIKATGVLSDRTKVTGGQFKEIQVSIQVTSKSSSPKVPTLEDMLVQLDPGVYGYDIEVEETVMDNVCKVVPECCILSFMSLSEYQWLNPVSFYVINNSNIDTQIHNKKL